MDALDKITHFDCGDFLEVEIGVASDLHIGDGGTDELMIRDFINWVKAKPNRFVLIAGDIFNAALKSSVSDVYSEALTVNESIDRFVRYFEPIKKRVIGVVAGNHDRRVWKTAGVDPVQWACSLAGIPYHGDEAQIAVKVGNHKPNQKDRVRRIHYMVFMTHGVGGGRTVGAKMNALSRLREIIDADVYIQGHTHQPAVFTSMSRRPDSRYRSVVKRRQLFVSTGAILKRDGYAKAFCYPEQAREWAVITLQGRRKWADCILQGDFYEQVKADG